MKLLLSKDRLEKAIKQKIKKLLVKYKVFYFLPVAGLYGKSGIPDFICCVKGKFLGIEAKSLAAGAKGQTPLQQVMQQQIEANSGTYLLVYNQDTLDMLEKVIKGGCDGTI